MLSENNIAIEKSDIGGYLYFGLYPCGLKHAIYNWILNFQS